MIKSETLGSRERSHFLFQPLGPQTCVFWLWGHSPTYLLLLQGFCVA